MRGKGKCGVVWARWRGSSRASPLLAWAASGVCACVRLNRSSRKPQSAAGPAAAGRQPGQPRNPNRSTCARPDQPQRRQKVAACNEAIRDGNLAGADLALAYLTRGQSESGAEGDSLQGRLQDGDPHASTSWFSARR